MYNNHQNYMSDKTKRTIAKSLIAGSLILILFVVGKALYSSPATNDSGLAAGGVLISQGETITAGATSAGDVSEQPVRLIIPRLEVDAEVQHVGLTESGNMGVPDNFTDTGWYKYGTVPGRIGSAVIAGHEDNAINLDGVFKKLYLLEPGDDIYVVRRDGERVHFRVEESEVYPYNDPKPLPRIFTADDTARLNLITCAGEWVPEAKTNDRRLVVFAKLVE